MAGHMQSQARSWYMDCKRKNLSLLERQFPDLLIHTIVSLLTSHAAVVAIFGLNPRSASGSGPSPPPPVWIVMFSEPALVESYIRVEKMN